MASYLTRIGGAWKYQRGVPRDVQPAVGKRIWTAYLGPLSRADADHEARKLALQHDAIIKAARNPSQTLRDALAVHGSVAKLKAFAEATVTGLAFMDASLAMDGPDDVPERPADALYVLQARRDHKSLKAENDALQATLAPLRPSGTKSALAALVDTYVLESRPHQKSEQRMRRYASLFVDIVGDLPLKQITRAHVIRYRDHVDSLTQVVQKQDHVETVPLGHSTKLQYLSYLHSLFAVGVDHNLMESNPAHGVKLRKSKHGQKDEGRRSFDGAQVRAILKAADGEREDYKWLFRLLAYHGMRGGEAALLRCEDVTTVAGVPVLRIHGQHRSLKNDHSKRDVPLHPKCRGIVAYARRVAVKATKEGREPWLFQWLTTSSDGPGKFQRWAGPFLREKCQIADRRLTVHSLRHTWRTCARELGMPETVSRAIMGHSRGRDDHAGYGDGPSMKLRAEWMARVDPLKG